MDRLVGGKYKIEALRLGEEVLALPQGEWVLK